MEDTLKFLAETPTNKTPEVFTKLSTIWKSTMDCPFLYHSSLTWNYCYHKLAISKLQQNPVSPNTSWDIFSPSLSLLPDLWCGHFAVPAMGPDYVQGLPAFSQIFNLFPSFQHHMSPLPPKGLGVPNAWILLGFQSINYLVTFWQVISKPLTFIFLSSPNPSLRFFHLSKLCWLICLLSLFSLFNKFH